MTTQPPQGDFPPVHPSGGDQTVFTRPDWLLRLPNFLVQLIEKIVGLVVQAITGIFLPGPIGSAFSQLANWATAILPAQILEPIEQLVDLIVAILGPIPFIGTAVQKLAQLFGLTKQSADQANSTNNPALASSDARIAALEALTYGTGSGGFDDFNGSSLSAKWSTFSGVSALTVSGGFVNNSGIRRAGRFVESLPATGKYKAQAAIVDISNGYSRLIIAGTGTTSLTMGAAIEVHRSSSTSVDFNLGSVTGLTLADLTVEDSYNVTSVSPADVVMVQMEENVPSAGQNTITAYLTQSGQTSPTQICTWVDTTNSLGVDGTNAHRKLALETCVNANGSTPGCGWDVFSYADIP